jgi:Mlc titration factor MtfA (ptsG expression regulator)
MPLFRKLLRPWIRKRVFPSAWDGILERNFPLYRSLPTNDRSELRQHMLIFLAEKHFEGCAGQEITDEIRVTIAAQACILLLHRRTDYYPGLYSVLVYPHAYFAERRERDASGMVTEGLEERLGEAWSHGSVVLSWDNVLAEAADFRSGRNVVFHEFAHQLDYEDGSRANGTVQMPSRSMYANWALTFDREFRRLRTEAAQGLPTLLDQYGTKDPAEFFAVTTEAFFTQPAALKEKHSALYEELKLYYQQDPVQWGI